MYMILYSTGTVFYHCYRLLRIRLKRQNPLLSYARGTKRKYTVNVQYSVQYTLLLLYLMLVMCVILSIKLYRIYVCYTNITLYIAFGIIRGFT